MVSEPEMPTVALTGISYPGNKIRLYFFFASYQAIFLFSLPSLPLFQLNQQGIAQGFKPGANGYGIRKNRIYAAQSRRKTENFFL
jgi:hypothetical protein